MQDIYTYHYSKEVILERMLSYAAMYYGVGRSELPDPVKRLFIESLGEEIYKVSGEVGHMEDRILDKLCRMLISDNGILPQPAYGILAACPVEPVLNITTKTKFYTNTQDKILTFYPAVNTRLYNGSVRYLVQGGSIFAQNRQNRMLHSRGKGGSTLGSHTVYIGIELDDSIQDIEGLSFFVDIKGSYNKKTEIEQFSFSNWKINNVSLPLFTGIYAEKEKYDNPTEELFASFDASVRINKNVQNEYKSHFLTVKAPFDITGQKTFFPKKLKEIFGEAIANDFQKSLLWIEITFPQSIKSENLQNIQIGINSFPAVNKRLVKKTEEVERGVPVIALPTKENESFISVSSVSDTMERTYYDFPSVNYDGHNTAIGRSGIYTLRQGGLERLDMREANDYLRGITSELDYSVSTFFRNKKEVKADLKQIQMESNKLLRELKNTANETSDHYEPKHYLMLDQQTETEIYFVEYWVCDNDAMRYMRNGQILQGDHPIQSTTAVITDYKQGLRTPDRAAGYVQYKNTLTDHKLLITDKDIEHFSLEHFRDTISGVQVRKGIIEAPENKGGFVRTKDIYLRPKKELKGTLNKNAEDYFRKELADHSPVTFRYRVFIDEKLN